MAAAGLTHGQLATKLVVEGCLAHIAGNVQGRMPIEPIALTELERADIGLAQGGQTLFYPLPPTGVFIDLHGPKAAVWFNEADADNGLRLLETELKRAHSRTKQLRDDVDPKDAGSRIRTFEVDLGNSRMAHVEVIYPGRGGGKKSFITRVAAQARKK